MYRRLIIAAALCASIANASPLLLLVQPMTDPSRMSLMPGGVFLPHIYTLGGETGMTICWWVRWECSEYDTSASGEIIPALNFQGMNSLEPAKPTTKGGAPLPSFYESDIVLDASGAWGLADIIPADPPCFPTDDMPNRYVVCCNISNETDITLTVGGSEKFLAATNGTHIFNLECHKGDRSIAITGARPNAKIKVGFAINPIIKFYSSIFHQCYWGEVRATNTFTFVCLRAKLEDGQYKSVFNLMDLHGRSDQYEESYEVSVDKFPRDCLFKISQFTGYGRTDEAMDGSPRKVDLYGLKVIRCALSDEQMWRIYDRDLEVIKARGLTNALPHKM